jgi:hypothetical protein
MDRFHVAAMARAAPCACSQPQTKQQPPRGGPILLPFVRCDSAAATIGTRAAITVMPQRAAGVDAVEHGRGNPDPRHCSGDDFSERS